MLVKASQKSLDQVMTAAEMLPAEWKICKISYNQQFLSEQTSLTCFLLFPLSTNVTAVRITYGNQVG